jgi:hypothetical protein
MCSAMFVKKNPKYTFYTIKSSLKLAYKGRPVKISSNIVYLNYKEIYMKYLIQYYNM